MILVFVWLAKSAEYFVVQEPRIEEAVVQRSAFRFRVLVQQSPGAVKMEMPISLRLIKDL